MEATIINVTLPLTVATSKPLAISFIPATQADEDLLLSYGNPPQNHRPRKQNFLLDRPEEFLHEESRFSDSRILAILKQAEAGMAVPDRCREQGISRATCGTFCG